jgi:RimJ/RimL family protein N-acetyltransferase
MTETDMFTRMPLIEGYDLVSMKSDEFDPLFQKWLPEMFAKDGRICAPFTDDERSRAKKLRARMGEPLRLCFGIYKGADFVGWHCGDQLSAHEYYMRNSAVFPEHRGKGLYTAMLKQVLNQLVELGFQEISSRHNATNNAVLIPKLKAGFIITGLEIMDWFGTLVNLKYYSNPTRRKVMDYRSGRIGLDEEIKRLSESK